MGPVKHFYTLGIYQSLNALRLRFVTSVDLFTIFGVVSLIWFGYWINESKSFTLQSLKNCSGMSLVRVLLHHDLINCSSIAFKQFWPEKHAFFNGIPPSFTAAEVLINFEAD